MMFSKLFKKTVIALNILTIVLAIAVPSFGQTEKENFGVFPLSGPEGIVLLISGDIMFVNPSDTTSWIGYNIYKKENGQDKYFRLTQKPISSVKSLAELEKRLGGPLDNLVKMLGVTTKVELWEMIKRQDTSIIALEFMSRAFRSALGHLYIDDAVVKGKTYNYYATMAKLNGQESNPSDSFTVTAGVPAVPLLGPLEVSGKSSNNKNILSWKYNPNDSGAIGYSIYRTADTNAAFIRINSAILSVMTLDGTTDEERTFTDSTVLNNRRYYYAVVSVDYAGNESPKKPLIALSAKDDLLPAVPQNVFAIPSDLGLLITWDKVIDSGLAGYNIYRSNDPDSNFTKLNEIILPKDAGLYDDKETNLIDRYYYRVTAVDLDGNESPMSARSVSAYANYHIPSPPQGIRVESQPDGILVKWEPNAEPDLQGYYIFRADYYNGDLAQVSPLIPSDTTFYLDKDKYLSPRGKYWYVVQAINYTGVSSKYSVPVISTPISGETPDVPLSFFGYQDDHGNRLFWRSPQDNLITGFNIYRAIKGDTLNWEIINPGPLPFNANEYTDSTAEILKEYIYAIRPIGADGLEGSLSHHVKLARFEPAPLSPGGLRVVRSGEQVKIIWNPSLQKSANGYRIYRRIDGQEKTAIAANIIPANESTYTDTKITRGTRYYYSIAAVDIYGREGSPSDEISINIE
jgi:fibronectin type 3 domain-containing protein